MPSGHRSTIVVCIGNELVADDAVGFEVYGRLGTVDARIEYCGTAGIDLLNLLGGETDMIVVDAVQLGAPAGTIHIIPWQDLPNKQGEVSAHGFGLREVIEVGRFLHPDAMPERIILVGIEGRCFNRTREFMTPEVSSAIDIAVEQITKLVCGGAK